MPSSILVASRQSFFDTRLVTLPTRRKKTETLESIDKTIKEELVDFFIFLKKFSEKKVFLNTTIRANEISQNHNWHGQKI